MTSCAQSRAQYLEPHSDLSQRRLLCWESPIWSALLALAVYSLLASTRALPWAVSSSPYYNYLADALLHGQVNLRLVPPITHDLIAFDGQYYLYWPPFPAALLLPFVAVFGVDFSDIAFTLGVAALNVALVALVLREACARSLIHLSPRRRALLVLFFALGTVHVTLAPLGAGMVHRPTGCLCLCRFGLPRSY